LRQSKIAAAIKDCFGKERLAMTASLITHYVLRITSMSHPDAERWNSRYAEEGEEWLERGPRKLLQDYADALPRQGLALDAAAGVANNGFFLASRGLRVIALDISEMALRLAMQRARSHALPLSAAVYDLASPWLPPDHFDVIVNFHFLKRATFDIYRNALKTSGMLFFETFVKTTEAGSHPDYYLNPGELLAAFQDFEILHWEEEGASKSQSHPSKGMARLVARKPKR
jgi:tellurite methyltransferase